MAAVTAAVAGGAALLSVGGSLVAAHQEKQDAKGYRNDAARKAAEIAELEKNRQAIPNPYANVKDISGMAKDLSGMLSNPFANLGVATQAAKMQTEEADISLANTLDTLRSTGASAGGATALAQAALQSKQGVSASIEQQEASNEKLKAQGVAQLQEMKMAEAQRLQNIQMSEAQRMQAAESEGIKFQYGEQENRDIAKLNRLSGQQAQSEQNRQSAKQSQSALYGSAIGAVGSLGGAALSAAGSFYGGTGASSGGGFTNPGGVPASIR
jgi:hypothetical protein